MGDSANAVLSPGPEQGLFKPTDPRKLEELARKLVHEAHSKSYPRPGLGGYADSPIGKGGKMDDTSVVIAEIVEWNESKNQRWANLAKMRKSSSRGPKSLFGLFGCSGVCSAEEHVDEYDESMHPSQSSYGEAGHRFTGMGVACKDVSRDNNNESSD